MQKLMLYGSRLLRTSFSKPKLVSFPYAKFSNVDHPISKSDFNISPELYTEEGLGKIQEIQNMPYLTLIEEVKKLSGKPKSRTKIGLIQFLIDQVPQKYQTDGSLTEDQATLDNNTESTASFDHYLEDTEEAINLLIENPLYRNIRTKVGIVSHRLIPCHMQNNLPYLENYPEKQMIEHINHLNNVDLKREMEQLIYRSPLYSKSIPVIKVRKHSKESLLTSFQDMIFVHREYTQLTKNLLKHVLSDPKGKLYNPLDCLEALRSLEKPLVLELMNPYFQTLTHTALHKFWNVIFESIDSKSHSLEH